MRGNLEDSGHCAIAHGSIPAHAGEPRPAWHVREGRPVYPRACGGTTRAMARRTAGQGLSPRMRGNHFFGASQTVFPRSIPAHAGEPRKGCLLVALPRVYPRACGGTKAFSPLTTCISGLSPRMRGNRVLEGCRTQGKGSIPAHAGEPWKPAGNASGPTVYPRACGGTNLLRPGQSSATGLSPRMRGNHLIHAPVDQRVGSIPAHAGEPSNCRPVYNFVGVYPRACGGTTTWA